MPIESSGDKGRQHKYGRGKFQAHPEYINYMHAIVNHPNYQNMPDAISAEGRINWQVSSGKTTSFYKSYLARRRWWIAKADELGLPGKNDEGDRFTVAARLINPSGYRPCRLCGQEFNVGYFYVNHILAARLSKNVPSAGIQKGDNAGKLAEALVASLGDRGALEVMESLFPQRATYFAKFGVSKKAFEKSSFLRSAWLTPGYMGNPPDRLDGFHDYCNLGCRANKDPGRSKTNLKSYSHDRRSFEWWAEGNWAIADALYNSAGPGRCLVVGCGKSLSKVSPDHVGPLACGFKQMPLFVPTCQNHNSTKNRRFSRRDVEMLLAHEAHIGESVASWQVRAHWDKYKTIVADDDETKALSNSLRSLQDMYLRTLNALANAGHARLLTTFTHPEYALIDVEFEGLDPSLLTYKSVRTRPNNSNLRGSLACRSIRIGFEELKEYCSKPAASRSLVRQDFFDHREEIDRLISALPAANSVLDLAWAGAVCSDKTAEHVEQSLHKLLVHGKTPRTAADHKSRGLLQRLFDKIGVAAEIDFSRYALAPMDYDM